MSDTRKLELNIPGVMFITLVVLVFLFVWPGPFRYAYKWGATPAKIDRISGTTYLLTTTGWEPVASDIQGRKIPIQQRANIHVNENYDNENGSYQLDIYNGSSWTLTEVIIEVKADKMKRRYSVKLDTPLRPLSAGDAALRMDEEMSSKISWDSIVSFTIIDARGYPCN